MSGDVGKRYYWHGVAVTQTISENYSHPKNEYRFSVLLLWINKINGRDLNTGMVSKKYFPIKLIVLCFPKVYILNLA